MLIPSNQGQLSKETGFTKTGSSLYGAPVNVLCAVVRLNHEIKKTPIRTDASASRGRADEDVTVATLLFLPNANIVMGDRFAIAGLDLRCSASQPRYNTLGVLDHYECTFEAWS